MEENTADRGYRREFEKAQMNFYTRSMEFQSKMFFMGLEMFSAYSTYLMKVGLSWFGYTERDWKETGLGREKD